MHETTAIDAALRKTGLFVRGALHPRESDGVAHSAATLVLIGNAGASLWRGFRRQLANIEGASRSDPLDTWIWATITAVGERFGAHALFPFDGPPFLPFQRWAMRTEPVHPSPLGILIHPQYGLWHAYRGALAFDQVLPLPPRTDAPSPCASCRDRPCLRTCPVAAVGPKGYDTAACVAHVRSPAGRNCLDRGCMARRACPVGRVYGYAPAHAAFHMGGFLAVATEASGGPLRSAATRWAAATNPPERGPCMPKA